jgi:hypothetical protein
MPLHEYSDLLNTISTNPNPLYDFADDRDMISRSDLAAIL